MDISWRIKELIAQSGLSQAEIAKKTGFSQQYISAVANGKKIPLDNLERLCISLSTTIPEFFRPFSKDTPTVPRYLQEFTTLCSDLTYDDIQTLAFTAKHLKAVRQEIISSIPSVLSHCEVTDIHQPVHIHGEAAAGLPLYSETDANDVVELPSKYADPEHYRVIRARGDSMEPKIFTGDIVVAEIAVAPYEGQMALVHLAGLADDEYTIQRVYHDNGHIILRSYNTAYPDMIYTAEEIRSCEAVAKVIGRGSAKSWFCIAIKYYLGCLLLLWQVGRRLYRRYHDGSTDHCVN